MSDAQTPRPTPGIKTVKVLARDEDFRIIQLHGNLFVCSKANGSCCCGWEEKDRAPVNTALYEAEWERRKIRNKVHLSFTGCLRPCATCNNALVQLFGQSIWFKGLNDDRHIPALFDYIEAMLHEHRVLPPPPTLVEHVFLRYLPSPTDTGDDVLALVNVQGRQLNAPLDVSTDVAWIGYANVPIRDQVMAVLPAILADYRLLQQAGGNDVAQ